MSWYLAGFKNYAVFSGRASRKEFWIFTLINAVIICALSMGGAALESSLLQVVSVLFILAIIVPWIAVTVRRLHDSGRSGAWYFISYVPFIGGLWLLALMLIGGDSGENTYGPDPRDAPV